MAWSTMLNCREAFSISHLHLTRHNLFVMALFCMALVLANHSIFPIYLNYKPNWKCPKIDDDPLSDATKEFGKNCTVAQKCGLGNLTFEAPFESAVQEFRLLCGDSAYYGPLMSTLYFSGKLVGAILSGQLADAFGRKKISIGFFLSVSLCSFLSAFANSWEMLTVLRFIIGLSVGGIFNVFFNYVVELIKPEQRLFLRGFFNWGWARIVFNLVCMLLPSWRQVSIFQAIFPLFIVALIIFCVPESPKWLLSKGKLTQMKAANKFIDLFNGTKKDHYSPSEPEFELEATAAHLLVRGSSSSSSSSKKAQQRIYTPKDLFSSRAMTKITLTMWIMWFATSLSAYANDLNSGNLAGSFYTNQLLFGLIIGLSKILVYFVDAAIPSFSRRSLHQVSQSMVVICYGIIIILISVNDSVYSGDNHTIDQSITYISLFGTLLIEYTFDACYVCAAECFPTVVRTIGAGSSSTMARIGSMIAPQMIYLRNLWEPSPYAAVFCVGIISLIVSYRFLPDTKGKELSDDLPGSKELSPPVELELLREQNQQSSKILEDTR